MARFLTVIAILTFGSFVFTGGLTAEAQCVDSVIVRNTSASIGSTNVVVPVYAHLCNWDTIGAFLFAMQYDSSFLRATDIIYEVHDSTVPSFYDLWPNPAMHTPLIRPTYLSYAVVFDFSGVGGIINPPEGRYCMFNLLFDVVAQETGTTLLDVTSAALGNKTPELEDGLFNVNPSGVEETFRSGTSSWLFALSQNYPNPLNPTTLIRYQLPAISDQQSAVSLKIYNILGQEVRTLVDEEQVPGYYSVSWDGRDGLGKEVSSGIYFYRLEAGDFVQTRKMVLIR